MQIASFIHSEIPGCKSWYDSIYLEAELPGPVHSV